MAQAAEALSIQRQPVPTGESSLTPDRLANIQRLTSEKLKDVNWLDVAKKFPKIYWEGLKASYKPGKDKAYLLGLGIGLSSTAVEMISGVGVFSQPIISAITRFGPLGYHAARGIGKLTGRQMDEGFWSKGAALSRFMGGLSTGRITEMVFTKGAEALGSAIAESTPTAHAAALPVSAEQATPNPATQAEVGQSVTLAQAAPTIEASAPASESQVEPQPSEIVQVAETTPNVTTVPGVPRVPDVLVASAFSQSQGVNLLDRLHMAVETLRSPAPGFQLPAGETTAPFYVDPDLSRPTYEMITVTDRNTTNLMPTNFNQSTGINPDIPPGKGNIYPTMAAVRAEAAFENVLAQTTGRYLPSTEAIARGVLANNHILNPAQLPASVIENSRFEAQGILEVEITKIAHEKLAEAAQRANIPVQTEPVPHYAGGTMPQSYVDISRFSDQQYRELVKSVTDTVDQRMSSHSWDQAMRAWSDEPVRQSLFLENSTLRNIDAITRGATYGSRFAEAPPPYALELAKELSSNSNELEERAIATIATNWREISADFGKNPANYPPNFHPPHIMDFMERLEDSRRGNKLALQPIFDALRGLERSEVRFRTMFPRIDEEVVNLINDQLRKKS